MPSSGAPSLARWVGANTAKPVGGRARLVAVVVQERVFGGQLRMRAIILGDPVARRQECLQERDLTVLVQVGLRVGDRLGEIIRRMRVNSSRTRSWWP